MRKELKEESGDGWRSGEVKEVVADAGRIVRTLRSLEFEVAP